MIYPVLWFFLSVIPFLVYASWGDGIRSPKEFLSILGFITIISVVMSNYRLKPFKNKFLLLFWIWCFVSTILSNYNIPVFLSQTVIGMPSSMFAWKELFYISLVIFTIYCISSFVPNESRKFLIGNLSIDYSDLSFKQSFRIIAKLIAIVIIIMSVYSIIQVVGLDEWFRTNDSGTGWIAQHPISGDRDKVGALSRRVVGTLGNPCILAIWLAICLPICLYLRTKIGYLASILAIGTIIITHSATAIVGAIVGVFIYLFFNFKKTLLFMLIILIPLAYFYSPKVYDKVQYLLNPKGRIEVHKEAFKVLENKAITGLGLGTFEYIIGGIPEIVKRLNNESWRELHDELGQVWWSVGIVGVTLFLCFIFCVIRQFFLHITPENVALFASLVAFLVMSISYFTMRISPISFYGAVFTGLLLRKGE